jgi:hypothetical protein
VSDDEGEKKYLVDGVDHGANDYMEILERHVPKKVLFYTKFADKSVNELEA